MNRPIISQNVPDTGNFTPKGWALCNGKLLSATQHNHLLSLMGKRHNDNGNTDFALPNLQGFKLTHYSETLSWAMVGDNAIRQLEFSNIPEHKQVYTEGGVQPFLVVNFITTLDGGE